MTNIKNTVSFYNNSEDSRNRRYMSLDYVLSEIIATYRLRIQTEKVRNSKSGEEFKAEKRRLPMIAPSGIFNYRNDDTGNLREYSQILILDFDGFPDHDAAEKFKERLIRYADRLHLYAVWFSVSNKGVKAAMIHDNTDPEHHYNLFLQVKARLYPNTEQFDMKCGNLSRTCFLNYDPEVWINPDKDTLTPFHFVYDPRYPDLPKKSYNRGCSSAEFRHTENELKINGILQASWKDRQLINYADKYWRKNYPDSYKDGNRHKAILSRAKWLCLYGVLFDNALGYLQATFGRHGIDCGDIKEMTVNNYNSNRDRFGSRRSGILNMRNSGTMTGNGNLKS